MPIKTPFRGFSAISLIDDGPRNRSLDNEDQFSQADQGLKPIILTGAVDLVTAGTPNLFALTAPKNQPMWVDSIKFSIYAASFFAHWARGDLGSHVRVALSLGNMPLTKGAVPLGAFTPVFEPNFQILEYIWILSRPLYVPAGAVITPNFVNVGFSDSSTSYSVRVSYRGRLITKNGVVPKKIAAPFVAFYQSPIFTMSGTEQSYSSTEHDLANDFTSPLYVDRFIGKLYSYNEASTITTVAYGEGDTCKTNDQTTLKMVRSDGALVLDHDARFFSMFDANTRVWSCPHILDSKSYYTATVKSGGTAVAADGDYAYRIAAIISMLGWREVSM